MAKTIEDYQRDWQNAKSDSERSAAHAGAESIRAKSGFSGGSDGSQKISISKRKDKPVTISSTNKNRNGYTTRTVESDAPDLTEQEKSIYYGAQDWAKDKKQYAYKDSYGYEHVGVLVPPPPDVSSDAFKRICSFSRSLFCLFNSRARV